MAFGRRKKNSEMEDPRPIIELLSLPANLELNLPRARDLCSYLEVFSSPEFSHGRMEDSTPGVFPNAVYSDTVLKFVKDCMATGLLLRQPVTDRDFSFPKEWDDRVVEMQDDHTLFETATLEDLRIYLTMIFMYEPMLSSIFMEFEERAFEPFLRRLRSLVA